MTSVQLLLCGVKKEESPPFRFTEPDEMDEFPSSKTEFFSGPLDLPPPTSPLGIEDAASRDSSPEAAGASRKRKSADDSDDDSEPESEPELEPEPRRKTRKRICRNPAAPICNSDDDENDDDENDDEENDDDNDEDDQPAPEPMTTAQRVAQIFSQTGRATLQHDIDAREAAIEKHKAELEKLHTERDALAQAMEQVKAIEEQVISTMDSIEAIKRDSTFSTSD